VRCEINLLELHDIANENLMWVGLGILVNKELGQHFFLNLF